MSCNCGKPKCNGKCGISPAVLQINNPDECTLFHKVEIPSSMGDSKTNPPKNGAYKNVLLYYEADQTSWLYSSDGIPTQLVNGMTNYEEAQNLPSINNHTLMGNMSGSDLDLQDKLTAGDNIQIDGTTISATDTTYDDFVGATSDAAGEAGLVPAPASGVTEKFLKSDGTWSDTTAFLPYPASVNTSGTTQQFIASIQALNAKAGTAFLGTVSLTDLPESMVQEEVMAYVYDNNLIYLTLRSADVAPYIWSCNSYAYRGWEPIDTTTMTVLWANSTESGATRHLYSDTSMFDAVSMGDIITAAHKGLLFVRLVNPLTPEQYNESVLVNVWVSPNDNDYQVIFTDGNYTYNYGADALTDTAFAYSSGQYQRKLTAGAGIDITGNTISVKDPAPEDFFTGNATKTDCGTIAALDDVLEDNIASLEMSGNTSQKKYIGKNLVYPEAGTTNGITLVYDSKTGTATAAGTATATWATYANVTSNIPAGTYTLSLANAAPVGVGIGVRVDGGARVAHPISAGATSVSFTTTGIITTYDIYFTGLTVGNSYNFSFKVQFESGGSKTAFEPYRGGAPSPSPSFPSVVENISGNSSVKVHGKNVWIYTPENFYVQGANTTYAINSDGSLSVTTTAGQYQQSSFLLNLPDGEYTFSLGSVTSTNTSMNVKRMTLVYSENNTYTTVQHIDAGTPQTVTLSNTDNRLYMLRFWGSYATSISNTSTYSGVQIELGNQASSYEAFKEMEFPLSLGALNFAKIDSAKDRLYNVGNKWYKHAEVGHKIIDADVSGIAQDGTAGTSTASYSGAFLIMNAATGVDNTALSSNLGTINSQAISDNTGALSMQDGTFAHRSGTNDRLYFRNSALTGKTGDEVKTILSGNSGGADLWYILATAVEEEITDLTLISQLEDIRLYSGYNAIMLSSDSLNASSLCVSGYNDNWSGNIDDVNDKIDSLEKKIDDKQIKFHSVATSSATYVIQFPNGKNMVVDMGQSGQWQSTKKAIDSLGIQKFDYAVLTHFHSDHIGNIQNFISYYDMADCKWYVQMKPDFTNHSAQIEESESSYDNVITLLQLNGVTPIVPQNESVEVVDEDEGISMRFLNTDATIAESYYSRRVEYHNVAKINFNDFSLITEITYGDNKILLTGDIERPVEDVYKDYVGKVTIMTAPHHGVNIDANKQFYYAVAPEVTICSFVTTSATWVNSYYRSFRYIREVSNLVVTEYASKPDANNLFSFDVGPKSYKSYVEDGGITEDSPFSIIDSYGHVASLVYETIDDKATLTLKDWVNRLPIGAEAHIPWWSDLSTTYAQLRADIGTLFPIASNEHGFVMDIARGHSYITFKIQPNYSFNNLSYELKCSMDIWNTHSIDSLKQRMSGTGLVGSITGEANLISELSALPTGTYWFSYKDPDSLILATDEFYEIRADLVRESSTRNTASLSGSIRDTGNHGNACVMGFFDNSKTIPVKWYNVTA